jgi:hypothetical protein
MASAPNTLTTQPYHARAEDHQRLEWIGGSTMAVLIDAATSAAGR